MNRNILIVIALLVAAAISADAATVPTNLSPRGVAEWAMLGGHISSGTGALPAVASEGARYVDLSTPTAPIEYVSISGSWVAIAASGGDMSGYALEASMTAHIDDTIDPHGSAMSVTESMSVGSGAEDSYIYRVATGVIGIASYACIMPQAATPSADIATGTLWYDSNTNKLRCYDGSTWQDMW